MNLEEAVEIAVAQLAVALQARFPEDPLGVLRGDLGLTVQPAEHLTSRADGGACDGMSFLRDGVIFFAPSPQSRRQNFTLGHELGHWLVIESDAVLDWVADQADSPRVLETLCDRIAQRLLLPESSVDAVFPTSTPVAAGHVLELFNASQASRPVCAIALARRLPGLGAVVIIDRSAAAVPAPACAPIRRRGGLWSFPGPVKPSRVGTPLTR